MPTFKLPVIDLARKDRKELAKIIVDALENTGFLIIEGVKGLDFEKLLDACKWFFDQPIEKKHAIMRNYWRKANPNVYRGYFPIVEGKPSRKEGFEFGRDIDPDDPTVKRGNWFYEPSVFPEEDGTIPFKDFMLQSYEVMHKTGIEILRLAALGLGIDELAFDDIFAERPVSTFRIMHYPPWAGAPPQNALVEDGKVVTTPDHTDSTFITLLCTFGYKGLEVLTPEGSWAEVESRPKSLVMNIGDVFSRMMGGRFVATRHRVIDIGVDRFSAPFFLEPSFDGDIGESFMSKFTGKGPDHKVEPYGPWMIHQVKYIKKFAEYKSLPEF